MKRYENNSARDTSIGFGLLLAALAAVGSLSGCGAITGIREADLWGAKFKFAEGTDFHIGANAIDRVDNRRGVAPMGARDGAFEPPYKPTKY